MPHHEHYVGMLPRAEHSTDLIFPDGTSVVFGASNQQPEHPPIRMARIRFLTDSRHANYDVEVMRVISRSRLRQFWEKHSHAERPLRDWYTVTRKAEWKNFAELRTVFPSADVVGKHTVFNIGGNKFRLVSAIHFNTQRVFVRHVLTHKEYDLGKWKGD